MRLQNNHKLFHFIHVINFNTSQLFLYQVTSVARSASSDYYSINFQRWCFSCYIEYTFLMSNIFIILF